MARILIEAGSISSERVASNAKADRILTACAKVFGYTGDTGNKQAVADFFLLGLVKRLEDIALAAERDEASGTAAAAVESNRPTWANGQ